MVAKGWGKKRLAGPGEGVTSETSCGQRGAERGGRSREGGKIVTGAGKVLDREISAAAVDRGAYSLLSRVRGGPLLN